LACIDTGTPTLVIGRQLRKGKGNKCSIGIYHWFLRRMISALLGLSTGHQLPIQIHYKFTNAMPIFYQSTANSCQSTPNPRKSRGNLYCKDPTGLSEGQLFNPLKQLSNTSIQCQSNVNPMSILCSIWTDTSFNGGGFPYLHWHWSAHIDTGMPIDVNRRQLRK
jgi:hypothetical protein